MTWIVIAGLTCAVIVLFADHSMAVARINQLEQDVVALRRELRHMNHPAKRKAREFDAWFD